MLSNVDRTLLNMPQTILNSIYDRIGFNAIDDNILRYLVVARVCQPMSKVATVDYLKSYFDEDVGMPQKRHAETDCQLFLHPGKEECLEP